MAAYTLQQLADIKAAYATGAVRVETPSLKTEFRNLTEMERIISNMEREIAGNDVQVQRSSIASFSKD